MSHGQRQLAPGAGGCFTRVMALPYKLATLLYGFNERDVRADLASLGVRDFDFSSHVLDRVEIHECNYNWKTFIEVYLEDYHVGPFHPGLGHFVTCDDLKWEFAPWASLQTVGITSLAKAGTKTYERWHKAVLDYYRGEMPKHGAIWLTYYPNIMVEWYPHVLVVSTLFPKGPQKTLNMVEFYYPEEIAAFEREYIEAEQAAYMETCIEDDEIALRLIGSLDQTVLMLDGQQHVPLEPDDEIRIRRVKVVRRKYTLADLLAGVRKGYR